MNHKLKKCFDLIDENMDRCQAIYLKNNNIIDDAERYLDLKIPNSYKLFLKKYGILLIGSQDIFGISDKGITSKSYLNTVWSTEESRKYGLRNNYLVMESSGEGPLYVLDCEGKNEVFLWHGDDVYEKLFDSFEDFLMERIEWGLESDEEDEE